MRKMSHTPGIVLVLLLTLFVPVRLCFSQKHALNREDIGSVPAILYGVSLSATTINAALTAIGSTEKVLLLTPGAWTLAANVTIPRNVTLWIPQGTTVSVNVGITLTINGPLVPDPEPTWFTGAGTVAFNFPQWPAPVGIVSAGCLPVVPGGSLTLAAFACDGFVVHGNSRWPVHQSAAAVTVPNSPTVWLAMHRHPSQTVAGCVAGNWVRTAGTHYVTCATTARPADPVGGLVFARIDVAASVITAVGFVGTWQFTTPVTLPTAMTWLSTSQLHFLPGGLLSHGGATLTIHGQIETSLSQQIFSGTGRLILGHTSMATLDVRWFGAVGDGTTDNCTALTKASKAAAERIALGGTNAFTGVYFPSMHTFLTTCGLPMSRRVQFFSDPGIRQASIKNSGTQSAIYTATYSTGTGLFTDNLNQTLAQVLAGTDAAAMSLQNLYIEQTGVIAGNAPSGVAWNAVLNLNGAYDSKHYNLTIDRNAGAAIGSLRVSKSFRLHFDGLYILSNSGIVGATGVQILDQNSAGSIYNLSIQGPWDIGITIDDNADATNGFTLVNPRIETHGASGNAIGLRCNARSVTVLGGYIERVRRAFDLGTIGGSACLAPTILGTFIGTDANTTDFAALNNVQNGTIQFQPQASYTVSVDEFVSATAAQGNEGNFIRWFTSNADTTTPASLGLNQGDNIVEMIGKSQDVTGYQQWYTTSASTLNRMDRHFDRITAETKLVIGNTPLASLPADAEGTARWCGDCRRSIPCTGSGNGAWAIRKAGEWVCGPVGYGVAPPATCEPPDLFLDTDETNDTNCATTNDNSLCLCVSTNTWIALERN